MTNAELMKLKSVLKLNTETKAESTTETKADSKSVEADPLTLPSPPEGERVRVRGLFVRPTDADCGWTANGQEEYLIAIVNNNLEVVKKLIKDKVNPNFLFKNKVNPDYLQENGFTPLQVARRFGSKEIVKQLEPLENNHGLLKQCQDHILIIKEAGHFLNIDFNIGLLNPVVTHNGNIDTNNCNIDTLMISSHSNIPFITLGMMIEQLECYLKSPIPDTKERHYFSEILNAFKISYRYQLFNDQVNATDLLSFYQKNQVLVFNANWVKHEVGLALVSCFLIYANRDTEAGVSVPGVSIYLLAPEDIQKINVDFINQFQPAGHVLSKEEFQKLLNKLIDKKEPLFCYVMHKQKGNICSVASRKALILGMLLTLQLQYKLKLKEKKTDIKEDLTETTTKLKEKTIAIKSVNHNLMILAAVSARKSYKTWTRFLRDSLIEKYIEGRQNAKTNFDIHLYDTILQSYLVSHPGTVESLESGEKALGSSKTKEDKARAKRILTAYSIENAAQCPVENFSLCKTVSLCSTVNSTLSTTENSTHCSAVSPLLSPENELPSLHTLQPAKFSRRLSSK